MRTILPRLRNLLSMLAAEPGPLPVKEVADRLRVSKRTVFRELANIGSVLDGYDLEVGSRPGEGIVLEGLPRARSALLVDLEKLDHSDPADKRERQDRLVLDIFRNPGQKLAAHADRLKVSVPTVSHDLDDIELWLAGWGLALSRKPGSGIFISGDEMVVRRVVLALMHRMEKPGAYPHPDILPDIVDLAPELDPLIGWMTPQSRDAFHKYMAVAAQRVMDNSPLPSIPERRREYAPVAERLAVILSEAFNIRFEAGAEIAALEIELAACPPNVPRGRTDARFVSVAGEMIALFDPAQAPLLRMDEALLEGLAAHLATATVRIRHRIEIPDPMREEIARLYPDVMRRSRKACEALKPFGEWLPESEVSLFAAHFGAALLRLSDQTARRQVVRVGVICVHGIGSSYLLASQVKRIFGDGVVVEVGWHGDREAWREYDALVSTTEIPDAPVPVVVVPPILGDDDVRRVGDALKRINAAPQAREKAGSVFAVDAAAMEKVCGDARNLLERFLLADASAEAGLPGLIRLAGDLFGETPDAASAIRRDLAAREAVSTQVIPELGITLLHCRTEGTGRPRFGVLRSADDAGGDGTAVVMLLPSPATREQSEMMGRLSAALVEREGFLAAIRAGGGDEIRNCLERILREFLFGFAVHKLKG